MPEHASLATALCAAEAEMPNAVLDKVNPHFKSRYASLESLRTASLASLTKHGLSISHVMDTDEIHGFHLRGILTHDKTGQERNSYWPLPFAPDKPQIQASGVTFGRRYTWAALVAIATEEDDDGERASADKGKTKSAHQARKDGIFPVVEADLRSARSLGELKTKWLSWQSEIRDWPAIWRPLIEEIKDQVKLTLADDVEAGPVSSERLRASLVLSEEESAEIDPPSDSAIELDLMKEGEKEMSDLPQNMLDEIERKVTRFRTLVTNAAKKRWERIETTPPRADLRARDRGIYHARQAGRTYRDIGNQHGLCVERIRAIVARQERMIKRERDARAIDRG